MRVLVTGAAGFIGSALCGRLAGLGADVHALFRPGTDLWRLDGVQPITLHSIDLVDRAAVERMRALRPSCIFDTAAEGGHFADGREEASLARHLDAVGHVVAAAVGSARVIHLGSSLEYGSQPGQIPETAPLHPTTARGRMKKETTERCLQRARGLGVEAVVLRPFHVYGPREQPDRLIPTAVAAGLAFRSLPMTASDPERDYVYIDDVVDACLAAASASGIGGQVFNVGTGVASSNRALVALLESVLDRRIEVAAMPFRERAADGERRIADIQKATARLRWAAQTDLRWGLSATVAWARSHEASGVGC